MKVYNIDDVTLRSQIMTTYRKVKIAIEKIIDYRVTSPSDHCCEIRILAREKPGILVIICGFQRQNRVHINIFLHKKKRSQN